VRVAFFGTPAFAVPTLEHLMRSSHPVVAVITQPDRPRGRGHRVSAGPIKTLALASRLPVLQPDSLARPAFEGAIADIPFDLAVVAAYGKILPAWLLATPSGGFLNVHASLLPKYRGASPVHRAVINGEVETGVTIMRVVQALDAGAMLARVRVPIGPDDRTDDVERVLADKGAQLLVDTLDRLSAGPIDEVPQDESQATYAPRLRKEEGVIDWRLTAADIHNLVRGLHPWPHAFTFGPRGRLILHRTRVRAGARSALAPGTIDRADPTEGLTVAAGEGTIEILELQAEGGRVQPARTFLAGHPLSPGERLGSA
jgi:methionyl-tRNA formyltransferase